MISRFQALAELKIRFPELFSQLEKLFPEQEAVAIGVSGGSDSMLLSFVLASFWARKKWNPDQLFFLHCNHHIRSESEGESEFLQTFFEGWNFSLFKREENGSKTEEVLRSRRYSCFRSFCEEREIKLLALGHNLTDRIETSLMHMIRGCGLNGFLNMKMKEPHHLLGETQVMRPLLGFSKFEIERSCKELGIPFMQDLSNEDPTTSLRNQIRNQFLFPINNRGKKNHAGGDRFFTSWKQVYHEQEQQEKTDPKKRLSPIRRSPYRNAEEAFEWTIPAKQRAELSSLVGLFSELGIELKKGELISLHNRMKLGKEGFRELGKWTIFLAHRQLFCIQGKPRFWEKTLLLEKEITESGIQSFGAFQLEIPKGLVGSSLRFPQSGDHFRGKLLTKRALNQKIPFFRRNALPLAEKDGKIIVVFKPQQLIF